MVQNPHLVMQYPAFYGTSKFNIIIIIIIVIIIIII